MPVAAMLEIDAAARRQPLERGSVVVHGNVAPASHGETVSQILGAGDASPAFQRFELKQLPLTYRAAANETGAGERTHRARRRRRVGTSARRCSAPPPTERAYTLDVDEQGRNLVVFGDGVRGARLPSGVNNVRAHLPQGPRASTAMSRADKLTQLMTRPLGLKSVSNPLPAEGGTDPEPADAGAPEHAADDAHARPRRVAARLRRFRARLHRHRQGAGAGAAAAGRADHRHHRRRAGRRAADRRQARCGSTCWPR